jgi:hypothetical protein
VGRGCPAALRGSVGGAQGTWTGLGKGEADVVLGERGRGGPAWHRVILAGPRQPQRQGVVLVVEVE